MQDYDPKWSASVVLDYLMDVCDAAKILTVCLEQIAENPPDLIPRLHWLLYNMQQELECIGDDGRCHAKQVRDYLHGLEPGEDDGGDRLSECPK